MLISACDPPFYEKYAGSWGREKLVERSDEEWKKIAIESVKKRVERQKEWEDKEYGGNGGREKLVERIDEECGKRAQRGNVWREEKSTERWTVWRKEESRRNRPQTSQNK